MALQYQEDHPIMKDIPIASKASGAEALADVFGKVAKAGEEKLIDMQKEASHTMFLQAQAHLDDLETKTQELIIQNPGAGKQIALKARESAKIIEGNTLMNRQDRENFNYISAKTMNNLELKGVSQSIQLNRESEKFKYISAFTRENLASYQSALLSDEKMAGIMEKSMVSTIQDKVMRGVLTAVEGAHLVEQMKLRHDYVTTYLDSVNKGTATAEHAVAYASTLPGNQTDLASLPSNETTMQLSGMALDHMSAQQIESNYAHGNFVDANAVINLNNMPSIQKVTRFQIGSHLAIGLFNSDQNYAAVKAEQKRLSMVKEPSDVERGKYATLTNMINDMEHGDGFLDLLTKAPEGARIAQEAHLRAQAINDEAIPDEEKKARLMNLRNETMTKYRALGIGRNIPDRYHRLLPIAEMNALDNNLFGGGDQAAGIAELASVSPSNRNMIANSMPTPQKQISTYMMGNLIDKADQGFLNNFATSQRDGLQFKDEFLKQSDSIRTKIQTKLWNDTTFNNITGYLSVFPPDESSKQTLKSSFVNAAQKYVMYRAAQTNDYKLNHIADYQTEFMNNVSRIFPIEKGDNYTVNKNDIDPLLSKENYQLLAKYAIDLVKEQKYQHMTKAEVDEEMLRNPIQMVSTASGRLTVVDSHNLVVTNNDGHEMFDYHYRPGMLFMAEKYEKQKQTGKVNFSGEGDSGMKAINLFGNK